MFSQFIFALFGLKFIAYFSNVYGLPQLCTPAQRWPFNNRDLVNDYRGNILLLAFMPLECAVCESQLKKYELMVEKLREIRIVVISPRNETSSNVQKFSIRFPTIRIIKESDQESLWQWIEAKMHDHLVFDRCSRLAKIIRSPDSSDNFHETFNALKSVVSQTNCGWCKYDAQKSGHFIENISPTISTAPQITAYMVTQPTTSTHSTVHHANHYQNQLASIETTARQQRTEILQEQQRKQLEQQQRQQLEQQQRQRYEEELRRREAEEERRRHHQQRQQYNTVYNHAPNSGQLAVDEQQRSQQNYDNTRYSTQNDPRYQQQINSNRQRQQQQQQPNPHPKNQNQQRDYTAQNSQYNNYHTDTRTVRIQTTATSAQPRSRQTNIEKDLVEAVPLYPDGVKASNGDDYYADYTEWNTPTPSAPQQQIPKPTQQSALWPTRVSGLTFDADQFGGLQLPCAGFTDEICYQQKLQLPESEIHQCCKDRLVMTDQCLPGKCSNITNQLCCIHKFLQAKFACCHDKRQGEIKKPGDHFSRCCYDQFVKKEDECCTTSQASTHWKFVSELCLPNVEMDLSPVKVKSRVPGSSQATIDFDFSKTDKWRFECKYGNQVEQYSFYEDKISSSESDENSDGDG